MDKQNVLIVEDEPLIALDIRKTLEDKGYDVVGISSNGTDALAMAANYKPDIVLMDILLEGEMDGIETSMRLREQVNPAIIYVTANTNKDILSKAISTNPYGYLNKPVNELDLLATIHTALNTHTLQQQLSESEARYRQLFNGAADAMFIHDFDGNFIQVNDAACEKLGYTREELCSMNIRDIDAPEYQHLVPERIEQLNSDGSSFFITSHIHREGYTIPVELHSILINYEGCQRIMSTARDMETIKRSLGEKSALLKEIHHRVKNNFQIISSLINYQVNTTSDPAIRDILCDIQNRIFTMATIHEKFYSSESCSSIDFSRFAKIITDELCHSCVVTGARGLHVQYDLDPVLLDLEESIPLGLILNEAVSNTLKHAFTGTSQAHKTLTISLKESPTRMVRCTISDNGIGIPGDVDINNPVNFGLSLLHLLSRQLDARITISSGKGTHVDVMFSKKQAHSGSL